MSLPPFPVDDSALGLLWLALNPHEADPDAERTSVGECLDLISALGGSDPTAVAVELDDERVEMRDQLYHVNDALAALIVEVRRLRTPVSAS